jgi:hypothetical protein
VKCFEQANDILLARRLVDVILLGYNVADPPDGPRLLQFSPDQRPDLVEAKICAFIEFKNHCLSV